MHPRGHIPNPAFVITFLGIMFAFGGAALIVRAARGEPVDPVLVWGLIGTLAFCLGVLAFVLILEWRGRRALKRYREAEPDGSD